MWAIGNINILGHPSQKANAANTALEAVGGASWPAMLDSVRAVFRNMRVLSHSVQFLPICSGGATDQPASPIEILYSRFGVDGGNASSAAAKLTGYGSNNYSTLCSPSDNRMSSYQKTYYPSKSSLNSIESYQILASSTAIALDHSTGNQGAGRTLGFLRIWASDLGKTSVTGSNVNVVTPYRVIERITVLAKDRRSGETAE